MALKEQNRVKRIAASGGGTLVADADESFLVKDIYCIPQTDHDWLDVLIQGTSVGRFAVEATSPLAMNHLPYPSIQVAAAHENRLGTVIDWLRRQGSLARGEVPIPGGGGIEAFVANPWDIRYPVASGETLTISHYAETGDVSLLYDVYEAGDVLPTLPNGTQSALRRYLHYGTNAASAADGDCAVATSHMWTGGDEWPFDGSSVAENNTYRLLSIIGSPLGKGASAANKGYTTHLKLIHENTVLFDEDRNGLPFLGDTSALSAASLIPYGSVVGAVTAEFPQPGYMLVPPLEFPEGHRLTTKIVIAGYDAGGPGAAELFLAYALERRYAA